MKRILATVVCAVLAAAGLAVVSSAPAQAAVSFTSTVVNQSSARCASIPGGASTSALQLQQQTCNSATYQNFTFNPVAGTTDQYTVATVTAGSCLDVFGASTADNATIIQYACHSNTNQRFRLTPVTISGATNTFNIVAVHSGKCVVPAGDSTANNVGLVQLPCSTATTRVWRLPAYTSGGGSGGGTFRNPLSLHGPDPFLQYYNGYYYLATTTWNSTITMRRSATLGGLATAPDTQIFDLLTRPTGRGTMWAPEFHLLTGPNGTRWYFYYTAGDVQQNLGSQRIHVLESAGLDPMGPYTFKADLLDPTANNTWELDGSILALNGQLYLMGTYYAGNQPLFIKPMSNPWTVSGTRRLLVTPSYSWETVGGAVAEGPEALYHNGKTFIVYSASHCSTPDYKMGMLTYNGTGDPLLSSSWTKSANPVFQRSNANGVYGPGHGNFFTSPDGTESWMAYHANNSTGGGCDMNRTTRAQKFTWNADGTPNFGVPLALSTNIPAPSGEPAA